MPTSPLRRVPRDASAKRRRSWVQRASEAPDGQTTTYLGKFAQLWQISLEKIEAELVVMRAVGAVAA